VIEAKPLNYRRMGTFPGDFAYEICIEQDAHQFRFRAGARSLSTSRPDKAKRLSANVRCRRCVLTGRRASHKVEGENEDENGAKRTRGPWNTLCFLVQRGQERV